MKLGLFGGIANNTYVMAKECAKNGHDVLYIRDLSDLYPFSQPVWEDCAFTLSYDSVSFPQWTLDDWKDIEQKEGWQRPVWVVDPQNESGIFDQDKISFKWLLKKILERLYIRGQPHRAGVIQLMRQCDALFVCGIEAEILAWASDVPYVIWPHGGDIRMAGGVTPYKGKSARSLAAHWFLRFYLHLAFKNCLWIGTHDPKGIGGHIGKIPYGLEHLPLPLPDRPARADQTTRHHNLHRHMESLGLTIPESDLYIFVPSRMDFLWKGTDALLRAASRHGNHRKFHFIFAGWGQDFRAAKAMIPSSMATFLPASLSKPLLFRFFESVDIVADQFLLGTYGTSAVEAISFGTPVLMSIDDHAFVSRGWKPPPVLNARDEESILDVLNCLSSGEINLAQVELQTRKWFDETHNEKVVVNAFMDRLNDTVSA